VNNGYLSREAEQPSARLNAAPATVIFSCVNYGAFNSRGDTGIGPANMPVHRRRNSQLKKYKNKYQDKAVSLANFRHRITAKRGDPT
jgi:hypothetical protein